MENYDKDDYVNHDDDNPDAEQSPFDEDDY